MALTAMKDYVDGIEDLKVAMGYGLPDQYPLGINGLGAGDPGSSYDNINLQTGGPENYVVTPEQVAASSGKWGGPGASAFQFTPNSGTGSTGPQSGVDQFFAGAQKLRDLLMPVFSGTNKRPKQTTIVQKQPDYTTYAVIAGAVVVASVLAIAVGKSGRRSDK